MSAENDATARSADIGDALVEALGFEPTGGRKLGDADSGTETAEGLSKGEQVIVEDPEAAPPLDDGFAVIPTDGDGDSSSSTDSSSDADSTNGSKTTSDNGTDSNADNGSASGTAAAGSRTRNRKGRSSRNRPGSMDLKSAAKPVVSESDNGAEADDNADSSSNVDSSSVDAASETDSSTTDSVVTDPVAKAKAETEAIRKRLNDARRKAGIPVEGEDDSVDAEAEAEVETSGTETDTSADSDAASETDASTDTSDASDDASSEEQASSDTEASSETEAVSTEADTSEAAADDTSTESEATAGGQDDPDRTEEIDGPVAAASIAALAVDDEPDAPKAKATATATPTSAAAEAVSTATSAAADATATAAEATTIPPPPTADALITPATSDVALRSDGPEVIPALESLPLNEADSAAVPTAPPSVAPATVPAVGRELTLPQRQALPDVLGGVFRRKRRIQARKVRRVVRHIDPWSVLTFSVLFHLTVFAAMLLASVLVWNAAEAAGTIENLETFILDLGDFETFEIDGDAVFRAAVAIAGIMTLASSVLLVLLTVVFNLISDLVGGIRMTVIEEETIRVRRRKSSSRS